MKWLLEQSRHMVVRHAAQEASMPDCEYIDRKKENMNFMHLYVAL